MSTTAPCAPGAQPAGAGRAGEGQARLLVAADDAAAARRTPPRRPPPARRRSAPPAAAAVAVASSSCGAALARLVGEAGDGVGDLAIFASEMRPSPSTPAPRRVIADSVHTRSSAPSASTRASSTRVVLVPTSMAPMRRPGAAVAHDAGAVGRRTTRRAAASRRASRGSGSSARSARSISAAWLEKGALAVARAAGASRCASLERPGAGRVAQHQLERLVDLRPRRRGVVDRRDDLDPVVEVARHHVGRPDVGRLGARRAERRRRASARGSGRGSRSRGCAPTGPARPAAGSRCRAR